jgi:hypothetical protein
MVKLLPRQWQDLEVHNGLAETLETLSKTFDINLFTPQSKEESLETVLRLRRQDVTVEKIFKIEAKQNRLPLNKKTMGGHGCCRSG